MSATCCSKNCHNPLELVLSLVLAVDSVAGDVVVGRCKAVASLRSTLAILSAELLLLKATF